MCNSLAYFLLWYTHTHQVSKETLRLSFTHTHNTYIKIQGLIQFHNVHFTYPSRLHTPVLRDVTLTAEPNRKIALVGASGCGKSTTLALIERFYNPTSGRITLDGVDIREINVRSLRRVIGLVSQEPVSMCMCGVLYVCVHAWSPRGYANVRSLRRVIGLVSRSLWVCACAVLLDLRGVCMCACMKPMWICLCAFLEAGYRACVAGACEYVHMACCMSVCICLSWRGIIGLVRQEPVSMCMCGAFIFVCCDLCACTKPMCICLCAYMNM